jgi:ligand-binding sensor domain-containing protein
MKIVIIIQKRKKWIFLLLTTFLFLSFHGLCAQQNQLQFVHLSIEDGLSQNSVWCIHQDSKGFMWFGTEEGLNRYDGYTFTHFKHDPSDSGSLSHNFVQCILEDRLGGIWVGTHSGGLNRFDRKTERFTRFTHDPDDSTSLSGNDVSCIVEDRSGGPSSI